MTRLCPTPTCRRPLDAESIGRRPGIVVGYCSHCDLVVMPGAELATVLDFPRSSSDRTESA